MIPRIGSFAAASLAAAIFPALCAGSIIGTTGALTVTTAPADLMPGALESDTAIALIAERQNLTLGASLPVDITLAGSSPSAGSQNFSPGTIPAGTAINSYLAHFDVVGAPSPQDAVAASGSVTFDQNILGLIVLTNTLNATDGLAGLATVSYPVTDSDRGLEIVPGGVGTSTHDQILLSDDLRTVTLNLRDGASTDEVRIITSAVPEPGMGSLIALSVGLLALRRRRYK